MVLKVCLGPIVSKVRLTEATEETERLFASTGSWRRLRAMASDKATNTGKYDQLRLLTDDLAAAGDEVSEI